MDDDFYNFYIESRASVFKKFINEWILNKEEVTFMKEYSENHDIYVFSGIIRDFFLGIINGDVRDIDLVIVPQKKISLSYADILRYKIRKNQFGGLKLKSESFDVDVWPLADTWGIKNENAEPTVTALLNSAFFNCSCIVYNYAKEEFSYNQYFLDFLETQSLDVVYDKNPNPALCIVNTLYYKDKCRLGISDKLKKWIVNESKNISDYEDVQLHHFHKVVYQNAKINEFINDIK